jgi:hypothetical protein
MGCGGGVDGGQVMVMDSWMDGEWDGDGAPCGGGLVSGDAGVQ